LLIINGLWADAALAVPLEWSEMSYARIPLELSEPVTQLTILKARDAEIPVPDLLEYLSDEEVARLKDTFATAASKNPGE